MRCAYENKKERECRSKFGIQRVMDFSYEKVGKIMKGFLNEQ